MPPAAYFSLFERKVCKRTNPRGALCKDAPLGEPPPEPEGRHVWHEAREQMGSGKTAAAAASARPGRVSFKNRFPFDPHPSRGVPRGARRPLLCRSGKGFQGENPIERVFPRRLFPHFLCAEKVGRRRHDHVGCGGKCRCKKPDTRAVEDAGPYQGEEQNVSPDPSERTPAFSDGET